jgi:hypothetical protein
MGGIDIELMVIDCQTKVIIIINTIYETLTMYGPPNSYMTTYDHF